MKICRFCEREYEDGLSCETSPAEEIGGLFLKNCHEEVDDDVCPACRENAGVLVLLGFDQ